jgi:hypothetical protein
MPIRTSPAALVLLATAVLTLLAAAVGCVPEAQLPADCDAAAVQREATLADDALDPDAIDVCRDQRVTIDFAIQEDGVLHLHGYDEEAPATEVHVGDALQLELTAVRSGQFPIELHRTDGTEVEVGILTVHEP